MRLYKHQISYIYVFNNGQVAVFDQHEQQMPKFQGRKEDVMPKIKRRLTRQKTLVMWNGQENLKNDTL